MIINLKSDTDLSGFYVIYEGSTNLEKSGIYGIAHLMEHLVCKAFDHLQDEFEIDGIDWNAYTSDNEVVFYITGLDEKVNKWKHTFIELLGTFNITKEQFENERNIVLEEYADSFNNQTETHMLNLSRKLFGHYCPIGLRKDLESLTYLDCLNFFESQYSKPTKIINVSKKNNYKNNLIDFADKKITKKYKFGEHKTDLELGNSFKDKSSLVLLSPLIKEDFAYVHFINSMLSMGLNSPLYQEVREKKGLVYFIYCYLSRMNDVGVVNISTLTSNKNADTVVDILEEVLSNPNKYMTEERFKLVRESYKVRYKKAKINRYSNVNKWIEPDGWHVSDILSDITYDKVMKVYKKYYKFDKFYVSNDKKEFK